MEGHCYLKITSDGTNTLEVFLLEDFEHISTKKFQTKKFQTQDWSENVNAPKCLNILIPLGTLLSAKN